VDHAINAGLDLEMPGLNKWRTLEQVERCITAKKVGINTIKERAKKVLELVQKCAKEAPEVRGSNPLQLA
jgi:beta-glucosidase